MCARHTRLQLQTITYLGTYRQPSVYVLRAQTKAYNGCDNLRALWSRLQDLRDKKN
jgi:hypothetical protein